MNAALLTTCQACDHQVSVTADFCPQCGHPGVEARLLAHNKFQSYTARLEKWRVTCISCILWLLVGMPVAAGAFGFIMTAMIASSGPDSLLGMLLLPLGIVVGITEVLIFVNLIVQLFNRPERP